MNPIVLDKLPEQIFHVVEYPGFVKNSGKAIETLGGELAVEDAFGKEDLGCLQLNYRPEDEFSHAINGDVINTSNLVYINEQERLLQSIQRLLVWLQRLADSEFAPDRKDNVVKLAQDIRNWNDTAFDKIDLNRRDTPESFSDLRNFPPPSFSRQEWAIDYNSSVVKAVVQGAEDGSDPVIKMVPRVPLRGPRKARTSVFNFDIMNRSLQVPTSKPENLPNISDEGMKEKLEELRNLFEDRPIWSRLALHNTTSIPYPELTILLGHLAYTVHLGAFRDLWVRFGVDPRTDRTLFIYQLIDLRNIRFKKGNPTEIRVRAPRLPRMENSANLLGLPKYIDKATPVLRKSHTLDSSSDAVVFGGFLQLIDVSDPGIRMMIDATERHQTDHFGWIAQEHFTKIKAAIKRKVLKVLGKLGSDDEGTIMEDMDIGSIYGMGESSEEDRAALEPFANHSEPGPSAEPIDERVSSRVDELMRSLQDSNGLAGMDDLSEEDDFGFYDED